MSVFSSIAADISRALSPDLPADLGDMDQHLEFILGKIKPFGEDLREGKYWHNHRLKEVRDDEGFHESILHIFQPDGTYLLSLDGNVVKGSWKQVGEGNTLLVEVNNKSELFDLNFLNNDFMVLSKHGDQQRKGQRKYFVLATEAVLFDKEKKREIDWRNLMEKMFNIWRENSLSIFAWIFFIVLIALMVYLSTR